jgi:hypothetical protein
MKKNDIVTQQEEYVRDNVSEALDVFMNQIEAIETAKGMTTHELSMVRFFAAQLALKSINAYRDIMPTLPSFHNI